MGDLFTGDELASDSYPCQNIEGVIMQLEGKFITKGGEDFGIENNDEEGGDMEEAVEKVINIVDVHRLEETKPERVADFQQGAQSFVKQILGSFSEYTFYTGESLEPDAMVVLCKWSEDGMTPYFQYWVD